MRNYNKQNLHNPIFNADQDRYKSRDKTIDFSIHDNTSEPSTPRKKLTLENIQFLKSLGVDIYALCAAIFKDLLSLPKV